MHFIDDDVAQAFKELRPFGVMRKDRLMNHVWIADDDVAMHADRLTRIVRRVAIESVRTHAELARAIEFQ